MGLGVNVKQRKLAIGIAAVAIVAVLLFFFLFPQKPEPVVLEQKVVVLAFDGMDPVLAEKYMQQGLLPNFSKLREQGSYARLATTNPAETPVAFASFSTGLNPGKHKIYGFLKTNPDTYQPDIGLVEVRERWMQKPLLINPKQGKDVWDILAEKRIRSTVLQVPQTFPADDLQGYGELLSGLGVPDVKGTMGTFSFYTEEQLDETDTEAGGKLYHLEFVDGKAASVVSGTNDVELPVEFAVDKVEGTVTISSGGKSQELRKGKWSQWFEFVFPLNPLVRVNGIGRFHINSIEPLRIYLTPINFDPRQPFFDLSNPFDYIQKLALDVGLFKTQGWAVDTWALNDGKINEDTFLEDVYRVFAKRREITMQEFRKKNWNLFVSVFGSSDRLQHMFWRYIDREHPLYTEAGAEKYGDKILKFYQEFDAVLGEIMEEIDEDTTLIVLSDHGFNSYRKSVNINTWLVENGFMTVKGQGEEYMLRDLYRPGGLFWSNVDWSKTKAYAISLGEIRINLKGREGFGIVKPGQEYDEVRSEIIDGLLQLQDPDNNAFVVRSVKRKEEIYSGNLDDAPDLMVGFNNGYRIAWESTVGGLSEEVIVPNTRKWSGDHVTFDPEITKGVLFVNKKLELDNPGIMDLAPTILEVLEQEIPAEMDGKSLLK